jgi:hypothetical protein
MTDTREITPDEAIDRIGERAEELKAEYTERLDAFANELVPPMLSNSEYAARSSALLTALNRELARCAASFGEVHGVSEEDMVGLVVSAFKRNFVTARKALDGAGQLIQ